MHDRKNLRWWIVGGAAIALILGFGAPRQLANHSLTTTASPDATVPSQLLTPDQNVNAPAKTPMLMQLAVYVCGDVRRPGVYKFTLGARVADGIERAGGALADADLEQLNLAEPLSYAMKIDVPKKGQVVAGTVYEGGPSTARSFGTRRHASRDGSRNKLQPGQTLNVNTASESELVSLPGVGPGLARRIIEYRSANGPFQTVDDLQNVSGIGPSKFERMAPFIRL
jgi:competence protein ComEA